MPVDSIHTAVETTKPEWQIVRDCIAGAATIRAKGEEYLPALSKQEQAEYHKFRDRAVFVNATGVTAEAMVGLIFRKPPMMDLPASLKIFEKDADLQGRGLIAYARRIVSEVASVGRAGTLIEWSETEKRPFFCCYQAEKIINWQCKRMIAPGGSEGTMILSLLVLEERADVFGDDEFAPVPVEQWRVLRCDGQKTTATVYRRDPDNPGKFLLVEAERQLVRRGQPLTAIPFVFHNADEPGPQIGKVPLADLAHVNISHYRTSADNENGLHLCGIPTPYFFGTGADENEELTLGSNAAWTSTDSTAKAGFVEFTGQGLSAIRESLTAKQAEMAALGARMIEPRKADAESYDTVALRASSAASMLSRIGLLTTEGLAAALGWAEYWINQAATPQDAAEGIGFALNADFVSAAMTSEMLTALIAARQANLISTETFFFNLQRGELFVDGWTADDEAGSIEASPVMPPPLPKMDGPPGKQPPPAK